MQFSVLFVSLWKYWLVCFSTSETIIHLVSLFLQPSIEFGWFMCIFSVFYCSGESLSERPEHELWKSLFLASANIWNASYDLLMKSIFENLLIWMPNQRTQPHADWGGMTKEAGRKCIALTSWLSRLCLIMCPSIPDMSFCQKSKVKCCTWGRSPSTSPGL